MVESITSGFFYRFIWLALVRTYKFGSLLAAQWNSVVGFVPRAEGGSVDEDDGVLHQCLGADQLVVAGVVNHIHDTGLARGICKEKHRNHENTSDE